MTKEKLKMIQVDEFVHRKIKELASSKGLSVKEFMQQVVNQLIKEDK